MVCATCPYDRCYKLWSTRTCLERFGQCLTKFIPAATTIMAKGKMRSSHPAGPAELVSRKSRCMVPARFSQPRRSTQQRLIMFSNRAGPMLVVERGECRSGQISPPIQPISSTFSMLSPRSLWRLVSNTLVNRPCVSHFQRLLREIRGN